MRRRLSLFWVMGILFMWFTSSSQTYLITNSALDVGNPGGVHTSSDATTGTVIQPYNNGGSSSTNIWSDPYAIPFSFDFYGSAVTHLMVSKNGLLTFDTTNTGMVLPAALDTNSSLPNANLPANTIAYFWDDMASSLGTNDQVHVFTAGSSPNRQLWILNYSFYLSTSSFNYFAVVLEETSNKIYVVDMNYASSASSISATVGIQINGTTAYEVVTPLNGANGSPNIQFGPGSSGATDNEYYEFQFFPAGACFPPSNLGVTNLTSTSADLYWMVGGATNWDVEYGPAGFAQGAGTVLNVTNDTVTVGSLNANANYEFYVRDSCGVGSVSSWSGPFAFTTPCSGALSGTYTIDQSMATAGTNFASFNEAAAALGACGVSGAVIFNVKEGTYVGRAVIDTIAGASSVNTVTFQPDATNTNPVEVTDSAIGSTDNYVIQFNNADWVTIDGITVTGTGASYSTAIEFSGSNSNITVQNCILNARDAGSTSTNHAVVYDNTGTTNMSNNITIDGNEINNGSYGIYLYGGSTSSVEMGHVVSDNTIQNFYYYGVRTYYQDGVSISGNTITSSVSGSYSTVYGIYNGYSDNSSIIANAITVYGTSTNYGIYNYYCDATALAPNLIANNMVSCIGNSGSTYGIYPYNNYYTDIVYNTVNVSAGSTTAGRALYLNSSSSGTYGNVTSQNNCLVNTGGGYVAEITSSAVTLGYVTTTDYNNFYGTGSTLVRAGTTNFADLASYQVGAMVDANSVSVDPLFVAPDDLHVSAPGINGVATTISGITTDIDGDTRSVTPDIGADEFTPPSCLPVGNLTTVTVYTDSAVVSWSANGGSSYNLEYDTIGYTQGTGTSITGILDTFITITGIMSSTEYDFYVQNDCGGSGTSPWSGPGTFMTLCAPFTAPYTESFDGTTDPLCWSQSAATGGPWVFGGSGFNSVQCAAASDHTGNAGNFAWMDQSSNDAGVVLEMNDIDVSGLTTAGLEFYYWMCGTGYSPINVTLVEAWDGAAWNVVDSIITSTNGWERMLYDVSSFTYGSGLVRIRFRAESGGHTSDFYGDNAIDDVTIDEYSTLFCAQPFAAPYYESFDNTTMPMCWSQSAATGGPWVFGGSGFNSSNCAAATDHTGNAGNFAWMDQSSNDDSVIVELHDVDVSGLTTPYLEFYYWMCGTGYSPTNATVVQMWDGTNWVTWDSISVATSGWLKIADTILPSQTYNSGLVKVRFMAISGGSSSDFYGDNAIDDIRIMEAPSCTVPTNLGLIGTSDMSATIYWTTGGASDWNIEYGTTGYTPGSGTMMSATNDTATIGSLMPGMSYDVYVRDSCAVGDVSIWAGPLTITTSPCDTASKCGHTVILSDEYGDGWNGSEVTVYQGGVPVAVLGGTAFTSADGSPPGDTLVTSLSLCDSIAAYFVITTGSTSSPYWSSEIGVEVISPFGVPLVLYDNVSTATQGDTIIMMMPSCAQPSCAQPLNLTVNNVSSTSAQVNWTSSSSTQKSFIEYGISGYTPGTGMTTNTTADSIVLMSLLPMTTYDVCIWDSCSATMSDTVCTSFTTACAPFVAPYMETFDTTITPQCWSQSAITGGPWLFGGAGTNSVNCSAAADHTGNGGNYAWMDQSSTDVGVSLEMGDVDVSALTTPYLEFYYWMCGAGYSPVNLTYIEAWDGSAWVLVDSIAQATSGWEKFGFDLSSHTYGSNLVKVRFRAESGGSLNDFYGDNAIDDVAIIEAPSCFDPTNLGATNISTTGADVYWTTGGAANWNVEYGTSGFTPGSGMPMNASNDTISLGSLSPGTAYEFYVRDSCGVGDVSVWAGPYLFYTNVCDTSNQCQFIVHLKDTYGDGWNGGEVTLYQSGVPVQVLQYPVINGGQNDTLLVMTIPLCDNVNTVATISSTGSFPSEIGLDVYDADTNLLGSHTATGGLSVGDTLMSFMAMCPSATCDSAGTSNTSMACVTDTAINLAQYLGPHSSGGMWMDDDATGALMDSTFDASMVNAGTYNFTYYFAAAGSCPADSATITVSVDTVIMLGASIADTICDSIGLINLDDLLDSTSTAGGSWVEITSSGAISGGVFDPSMATGQTVTVRYKVSNACGMDSVDVSVYVADCSVGLEDYLTGRLEMYPNPAKDVLNISLKGESLHNTVVRVYSANGQLVQEQFVSSAKVVQLDMSSLPKGVYTIKVNTEQGATARQISKM